MLKNFKPRPLGEVARPMGETERVMLLPLGEVACEAWRRGYPSLGKVSIQPPKPSHPLTRERLAAARARLGSDMPPAYHSPPRRRFATQRESLSIKASLQNQNQNPKKASPLGRGGSPRGRDGEGSFENIKF